MNVVVVSGTRAEHTSFDLPAAIDAAAASENPVLVALLGGLFEVAKLDRPHLKYPKHVPVTPLQLQPAEPNAAPDVFEHHAGYLAAPGSRKADNGTLWVDYPAVGGPAPRPAMARARWRWTSRTRPACAPPSTRLPTGVRPGSS
mgnify:CR=1 FL=1